VQIFFAPLQKELGLNALQMLFHLSPLMTFGSILAIPLLEDVKALVRYDVTYDLAVDVLVSCVMALGSNVTNFLVLSWASPLTYQVIGHMKVTQIDKMARPVHSRWLLIRPLLFLPSIHPTQTIGVLVSGVFLYDSIPSTRATLGMVLALAGVIAYTEENRRQQAATANTPQAVHAAAAAAAAAAVAAETGKRQQAAAMDDADAVTDNKLARKLTQAQS
jgi:hypothetical protein